MEGCVAPTLSDCRRGGAGQDHRNRPHPARTAQSWRTEVPGRPPGLRPRKWPIPVVSEADHPQHRWQEPRVARGFQARKRSFAEGKKGPEIIRALAYGGGMVPGPKPGRKYAMQTLRAGANSFGNKRIPPPGRGRSSGFDAGLAANVGNSTLPRIRSVQFPFAELNPRPHQSSTSA